MKMDILWNNRTTRAYQIIVFFKAKGSNYIKFNETPLRTNSIVRQQYLQKQYYDRLGKKAQITSFRLSAVNKYGAGISDMGIII